MTFEKKRNLIITIITFLSVLVVSLVAVALNKNKPQLIEDKDIQVHGLFSGGDGSESNPYQISDPYDLNKLSLDIADGNEYEGKNFILTNDINFGGYGIIGTDDYWFKGKTFNGQGYRIFNISIDELCIESDSYSRCFSDGETYMYLCFGLFTRLDYGTTIENLKVDRITVDFGGEYYNNGVAVGGIVGMSCGAIIRQCEVNDFNVDFTYWNNCHKSSSSLAGVSLRVGGVVGAGGYSLKNDNDGIGTYITHCLVRNVTVTNANFFAHFGPALGFTETRFDDDYYYVSGLYNPWKGDWAVVNRSVCNTQSISISLDGYYSKIFDGLGTLQNEDVWFTNVNNEKMSNCYLEVSESYTNLSSINETMEDDGKIWYYGYEGLNNGFPMLKQFLMRIDVKFKSANVDMGSVHVKGKTATVIWLPDDDSLRDSNFKYIPFRDFTSHGAQGYINIMGQEIGAYVTSRKYEVDAWVWDESSRTYTVYFRERTSVPCIIKFSKPSSQGKYSEIIDGVKTEITDSSKSYDVPSGEFVAVSLGKCCAETIDHYVTHSGTYFTLKCFNSITYMFDTTDGKTVSIVYEVRSNAYVLVNSDWYYSQNQHLESFTADLDNGTTGLYWIDNFEAVRKNYNVTFA